MKTAEGKTSESSNLSSTAAQSTAVRYSHGMVELLFWTPFQGRRVWSSSVNVLLHTHQNMEVCARS